MGIMNWLIRIGLDATQVESGLLKARSASQRFARDLRNEVAGTVAGAFAVNSVVNFAKSVVNMADEIGDLAEQFNLTTEEVQRLQILANQTGVSFEKMSSAVLKMNEAREKALEDDGKERQAFLAMGIKLDELRNLNTTNLELVRRIGQAYVDAGKPLDMQAQIADLLSIKLVTAAGAIAQIDQLGPVSLISDEEIKKLGEFNDRLDELERNLKVAAAPKLSWFARTMQTTGEMFKTANAFLSSDPEQKGNVFSKTVAGALTPFMAAFAGVAEALDPTKTPATSADSATQPEGSGIFKTPSKSKTNDFPFRGLLGGQQDPLARVGGFTMFGASQDRIVRELRDHGKLLRDIKRANETVAQEVKS